MTALALNLLALVIVLGLCWGAMMWLSGRFHGHPHNSEFEFESVEVYGDTTVTRRSRIDDSGVHPEGEPRTAPTPCAVCEGVGAQHRDGRLMPCTECYGTGVLNSAS